MPLLTDSRDFRLLKGYLLSEIKDDSVREKMNGIWKEKVLSFKKDDDKGDETFIKVWLRAHYAETIRDTKAGAVNKDFDIIGGSFHKWVRDERAKLGLNTSDDLELFIKKCRSGRTCKALVWNDEMFA